MKKLLCIGVALMLFQSIANAYTWKVTNNIDIDNGSAAGEYVFMLRIGTAGPGGLFLTHKVAKGKTEDFSAQTAFKDFCLIYIVYQSKKGDNSSWQRIAYVGDSGANLCSDEHIVIEKKDGKVGWHFAN